MVVPVCDPGPDVAFECLDGTLDAALSSGSRQYRRLNRAGDRQANAARHRIVQTRLRCDPRTQEYCEGRLKQGKTDAKSEMSTRPTGEQCLWGRGVGELLDGSNGHPELPLDGTPTVSCLQQGMDGGVPGPGPVGEPVPARPRRRGRVRGWDQLGFGLRCPGCQHAQAKTVLGDAPLSGLAQVVPQMPPVRDLDRLRRPAAAPSVKNGARSRQTTSTPGRWASQAARLDASRSGRRSIGRRVSTSTRTVP